MNWFKVKANRPSYSFFFDMARQKTTLNNPIVMMLRFSLEIVDATG